MQRRVERAGRSNVGDGVGMQQEGGRVGVAIERAVVQRRLAIAVGLVDGCVGLKQQLDAFELTLLYTHERVRARPYGVCEPLAHS